MPPTFISSTSSHGLLTDPSRKLRSGCGPPSTPTGGIVRVRSTSRRTSLKVVAEEGKQPPPIVPSLSASDRRKLAAAIEDARRGLAGALGLAKDNVVDKIVGDQSTGPTNEVVETVDGIRRKRLGGSDIVVSEVGLGTQRWASGDFNAPDEALCHQFMDRAILESGVNLIDTAEQYPIPSTLTRKEGLSEKLIGRWIKKDASRREKVVIATKITGGGNIYAKSIVRACEGSLQRLGTDYLDLFQTHWPARYSPQANWGQSLRYDEGSENANCCSFEELAEAMGRLVEQGKIRGWGLCNDNAVGLVSCCQTAKRLGVPGPISMQNDFSLIDRRAEENGVSEASRPMHENVGFLAYNALAGGFLTGKYLQTPAACDDLAVGQTARGELSRKNPRGRHDDMSWGQTLYRYRSVAAAEATEVYAKLAAEYGMSLTELSLRWCRQRASVTSVLLGCSSMQQLEADLKFYTATQEDLPQELMNAIDAVHMRNRLPIFSNNYDESRFDGRGLIGECIP